MLMREDRVVLGLFEGELDAVREVAKAAEIPFERILETARSLWNLHRLRRTRAAYLWVHPRGG
jgi:hypothetical protein